MKDGRLNICKECKRKYIANRPKDRIREIERKRNQKPARKEFHKQNLKRWRQENPEKYRAQKTRSMQKYKARNAVSNAVRDGRLERKPCEVCGSLEAEGHHEDYSKPLDVRWLCGEHYREQHLEIRISHTVILQENSND